jgi:hypothetical protein
MAEVGMRFAVREAMPGSQSSVKARLEDELGLSWAIGYRYGK